MREGGSNMSNKSITFNRSAAAQLEDRKHPQRYVSEVKEVEIKNEEPEANEANLWLLGPERHFPNNVRA
jgi:hypothetical protein